MVPSVQSVRRVSVLLALALSAFAFNTTENLPIGLLPLIAADLDVPAAAVGRLVSWYGLTVALVSLPLAQLTRAVPRRYLLSARIATALAQALFWAVAAPVAVGLFPPAVRGRVVAVMSVGGTLATVAGVPAGTWLGQQEGWRAPLVVLTVAAVAGLVAVAALLPTTPPEASHGAYASAPDRGRFAIVLVTTAVSVTGMFAGFTYVTELLTGAGFADRSVAALLAVFGLAGLVGVAVVGRLVDRFPRGVLVLSVGLQAAALLGLPLSTGDRLAVVGLLALLGAGAAPVFVATQARILLVAPGRTELGFAANSATFNVGVALGALVGGLALPVVGARGAFALGGLLTVAALLVVLAEPLLANGRADATAPA